MKSIGPKCSFRPLGTDNYYKKNGELYSEKSDTHVDGPWEFGKRPLQMNDSQDNLQARKEKNERMISTPLN